MQEITREIECSQSQLDFSESTSKYIGFVGGRGSGKSWAGAFRMLTRARPERTYLVASPTGVIMADTTFPTFKKMAQDMELWGSVKLSPYPTVTLVHGATIRFRSAEDPERMRGPNLSGIWLDEASLMHEDAYLISIACLREAGEQGWLSATFTPAGLTHWTYNVFGQAKPDTAIFHARTRDNPFLPQDFQDTLALQYSGLRAQQELEGRFVAIEGAEWPAEFFPDSIWFDEWLPLPWKCRVMALDPSKGKADETGDYSSWCMLGVDDQLNLWVDVDMDNSRPVDPGEGPSIIGDGCRLIEKWHPDAIVVEVNGFQSLVAQNLAKELRQRGLFRQPVYTIDNREPKETRIRSLGPYLAQRRLRIRKSKGGQLLMGQLRDFPVAEHDDGPDSLKLAEVLANHLLTGADGVGQPEVLRV